METVSYTLRLPVDVRDALEQNAAITGKSCAQLVIEALAPADPQLIYLMKRGCAHKIGISSDPARRRTSLGFDVELAWSSEVSNARGVEFALHNHFKNKRLQGEWFDLDEREVEWVKCLDLYHPVDVKGFVSGAVSCKCHPPKFATDTARWRGFSWVPYECRKRSWNHDGGSSKRPESEPVMGRNTQKDTSFGAGDASALGDSQPRPIKMNDAMAKFMATVHVPVMSADDPSPRMATIELCSHKEWSEIDGEQYQCRLQAGHKGKCAMGERV